MLFEGERPIDAIAVYKLNRDHKNQLDMLLRI